MKVAVFSNNVTKFIGGMLDHWKAKGHDVKFEMGANVPLAERSDVVFVDQFDNNVNHLHATMKNKDVRVFARALDWDVWMGLVRSQEVHDWLTGTICIADHIYDRISSELEVGDKLHLIKPGLELDKFTMKKEFGGYNIVLPCNEIDWYLKNVLYGIVIFKMLVDTDHGNNKKWRLFIKGHFKEAEYFRFLINSYIEKTGLTDLITIDEEHVGDYNGYLEKMDYCLVPSLKEAFSYVTAECAAKGIKPILNWWYGAERIWPKEWIFTTPDEAVSMIAEDKLGSKGVLGKSGVPFKPEDYRKYVEDNYSHTRMMAEMDKVMGL